MILCFNIISGFWFEFSYFTTKLLEWTENMNISDTNLEDSRSFIPTAYFTSLQTLVNYKSILRPSNLDRYSSLHKIINRETKKQPEIQKQWPLARRRRNHLWGAWIQHYLQSSPDWLSAARSNQKVHFPTLSASGSQLQEQPDSTRRTGSPSASPLLHLGFAFAASSIQQPLQ